MADAKITTGYVVHPRSYKGGVIYAVMREYTYRGKPSAQLVTIYGDRRTADSIRMLLNENKDKEI
jgi:hypothetical protein